MKKYTYEEVYNSSLEYFNGDDLAAKVFVDKYALQDNNGKYDEPTPTDMHKRIAKKFAQIEAKYPNSMGEEEIFNLFDKFKFIVPQGSPLNGIENPYQIQSVSNCFVLESPEDSYAGIMKTDQEEAHIMRRRGGVGFDISKIRPKGLSTNNAARTTDGIGIFMQRFSNTCREVAQGSRRGALMLTISVHHPEILTFINIKKDLKKITGANISIRTTNEFMEAVKNNQDYELRWPVDSENPKIKEKINAKKVWDELIESAWQSAEPGVLFWDTVQKYTPTDIYKDFGYESISTNPCFSDNTLIAVADGRNAVSIKILAEEGKDVPVYSIDKTNGSISIKLGRNPRITGYNKKIIRIFLDDNSHFDVTPDHKCILRDGSVVLAKDLKYGDSLPRFKKYLEPVKKGGKNYYTINCNINNSKMDRVFEHRLIAKYHFKDEWDNLYSEVKKNGFIKSGGIVVHHKDFDQLNNFPDNLQIMTFKDHSKLHGEIDQAGNKNGRYSGFTSEQIKQNALELTKLLGHRFSQNEWYKFAKEKGLPQAFSKFRKKELGTVIKLAKLCAIELNMEYVDEDPRIVQTYKNMLSQGYNSKIENNKVFVERTCEICSNIFSVEHYRREVSFCSSTCMSLYINCDIEVANKRNVGIHKFNLKKMENVRLSQTKIYSDLKFELKREPKLKEWEDACKKNNIASRIGKKLKFAFKNFKEVAEAGNKYNHKVIDIKELDGEHTVYNITVDDNHTVGIITNTEVVNNEKSYNGVFVAQCGEIVLSKNDSCRLMVLNLESYVKNPFSEKAEFDFSLFASHVKKAQRLMDDLVDIEIECVENIIKKIESDPEDLETKQIELSLWKRIKDAGINGRRTGLGITALGDCLASLNIKYGSKKSIEKTEEIYKYLALNAYRASVDLAKERGSFPVFNLDLEKNHPYLERIWKEDQNLFNDYIKYGKRNIALLTTAPTGSISTLTKTTSGIEPPFLLSYIRRKKINSIDKETKVDFIDDLGDKWQEFTVYHHGVKKWMDITKKKDIKESPYFEATSNEIDWLASVEIQSVAQKWIDHSISKTCNLPNNATKELVSEVYMKAWELGCKGFTVYRDGCRSGVLLSEESHKKQNKNKDDRPTNIEYYMAPKRPEKLSCEIKKVKISGEAWTIFVGLLDSKPYELFGGLSKYVEIPNKYKTGSIVKNGKVNDITTYNLIVGEDDDQMTIKDIANVFDNPNYGAFTRTISLSLRHGVPLQYVVEQLSKDKHSDMTSFSKVISRVFKSYIKDGTKASSEKKCPNCSAINSLVYQEGCLKCNSCVYSKCG